MVVAIFNLAIGLVMLVAGASGELVMLGTSSSPLLAIAGGVVAALGFYQLVRALRGR